MDESPESIGSKQTKSVEVEDKMIPDYISGSDIAEKTGWNEDTMLQLFTEFVSRNNLEDSWLEFLNDRADEELAEINDS